MDGVGCPCQPLGKLRVSQPLAPSPGAARSTQRERPEAWDQSRHTAPRAHAGSVLPSAACFHVLRKLCGWLVGLFV